MFERDNLRIQELIDSVLDSITIIKERTQNIKCADDFLLTPDKMFLLDGICMKLIFIGESIKSIDRLSEGSIFSLYPSIPWKSIMKMRDVIAHHYFKIDADVIYETVKNDLNPLQQTLELIKGTL